MISDFLSPDAWMRQSAGPRYVQLRRRLEAGIRDGILPPPPLPVTERLVQLGRDPDSWRFEG